MAVEGGEKMASPVTLASMAGFEGVSPAAGMFSARGIKLQAWLWPQDELKWLECGGSAQGCLQKHGCGGRSAASVGCKTGLRHGS